MEATLFLWHLKPISMKFIQTARVFSLILKTWNTESSTLQKLQIYDKHLQTSFEVCLYEQKVKILYTIIETLVVPPSV